MKKVRIEPGICRLITQVEAESEDGMEVTLRVKSDCAAVKGMFEELGGTFDVFSLCLCKPGEGPFYEYARKKFPGHASCPVIAGILKCAEAECNLALPHDVAIVCENEAEKE